MSIDETLQKHLGPLSARLDDLPRRMIQSAEVREYERLRTRKIIRLPVLSGAVTGNAITLGGDTGEQLISPEEGYIWSIRELNVEGLFSGGTPDVVNFYRNQSVRGKIFWQLNGNVFCQTFGLGEKILFPGDSLLVVNVGAFNAATTSVTVSGTAFQVATERQGEFF